MSFKYLTGAAMLALALTACTSEKEEPQMPLAPTPEQPVDMPYETNPIALEQSMLDTRDAATDFSCRFFAEAVKQEAFATNDCVSPYSLFAALSMTANGDDGKAARELTDALGAPDIERLNEYNTLLLTALQNVDAATTVKITNSIWVNEGYRCTREFEKNLADTYLASFSSMKLNTPEAMQAINAWASASTDGLITDFLKEPMKNTVLAVLNTLYFKAPWSVQFDKELTENHPFRNANGTTSQVDMMHNPALNASYGEWNGAQVVNLPYANRMFSMTVILPSPGVSIAETAAAMNAETLRAAKHQAIVNLYIPKFETKATSSIIDVLQRMGISFDSPFTKMVEGGNLFVSNVLQATRLTADEYGTEAAAVTAVEMDLADGETYPRHIDMCLDRPFIFAITEKSSGAVLFMGQVSGF